MIRPAVPVRLLRAPLQPRQGPVVAAGIPVGVIGVFQAAARGQGPARLFRFAEFVQQAEVTFPGPFVRVPGGVGEQRVSAGRCVKAGLWSP